MPETSYYGPLTTWKNAPAGPIRKADVGIARNGLDRDEIEALNLIVSAYLDFAELQARSHRAMHMKDWIAKLDDFLRLSDRDILTHAGKISHDLAIKHAHEQFARHERARRQLEAAGPASDLDRAAADVKRLGKLPGRLSPPEPGQARRRKHQSADGE